MRVAVTGSSGLIGQALLPALQAKGFETLALVRRPPARGEVQWDPARGTLDPAALNGIGAAINLAGESIATRWTDESRRRIRDSRIAATTLLATTMARLEPRPETLISVSAVGIYGDRADEVLTETSTPGLGFLPSLAQDWEAAAQPARDAGIRVVHPRMGIVLTEKGGALDKMLLPFKLGVGGRMGSGEQWMSWIAMEDVIAGFIHLLESPAIQGPVNFTAPGPVRNVEFTRALGRALHRPTILPVPLPALHLLYGKEMPREALLASTRVKPQRLVDSGFRFRFSEIEAGLEHVLDIG
jgi:uncharacterized protein (TIGR01777 family)